ncbi:hypothetical protein ElyMa_004732900 [Elysia marginata]|uniref:Uncharacterized protein n=1 Tax=Elysia marginata TaxID=1093978 RepID=A0AAV4IC75_9GAST|nr:hypothetical protein ElyMa_004732900 [Elysia marginata]
MQFLEHRFHRQPLLDYHRPKPAWVNDRPGGNQRFHSEPRQRNEVLQSLAPAGAKGTGAAVVSQDGHAFLYRTGNRSAFRQQGGQIAPRQKSLPARKPIGDFETKQVIHGIRTRSHEENYIRSNKFASSWAKVRAENLALRDGSPSRDSNTKPVSDNSSNLAKNKTDLNKNFGRAAKTNGISNGVTGPVYSGDHKMKTLPGAVGKNKTLSVDKDNGLGHTNGTIENGIEGDTEVCLKNIDRDGLNMVVKPHTHLNSLKVYKGKKDTGPSLPHTKSHAETENISKEKKDANPYIFKGHFRQEADSAYHKLDTAQLLDQNNLDYDKSSSIPSTSKQDIPDKTQAPEFAKDSHPAGISDDTKAKQTNSHEKNTDSSSTVKKQIVQNLINNSRVKSQVSTKDKRNSKTHNANLNLQQAHPNKNSPSRNKPHQSSTENDSKKPNGNVPPKPSAIALLYVLDQAKSPEKKKSDTQNTTSVEQSRVNPNPEEQVFDSSHKREPPLSVNRPYNNDSVSNTGPQGVSNLKNQPTSSNRSATSNPASKTAKLGAFKPQNQPIIDHRTANNNSASKTAQRRATEQPMPSASGHGSGSRRGTISSKRSAVAPAAKKNRQGNAALTNMMFDVNMGPSWDPHQKVPKMEGIDTVVVETKDRKGM